jgi:hypothetical protein
MPLARPTGERLSIDKLGTIASAGFEPGGRKSCGAKQRVPLLGWGSLLPASGSLIARKFSLFRRLGNSIGKRLNFLPKAEAPWLSQARNRRISHVVFLDARAGVDHLADYDRVQVIH